MKPTEVGKVGKPSWSEGKEVVAQEIPEKVEKIVGGQVGKC